MKEIDVFDLDDFIEIYDRIFQEIIKDYQFPTMDVSYFLESILLPVKNKPDLLKKQDEWIRHCIQTFANDMTEMRCILVKTIIFQIWKSRNYNNQMQSYVESIVLITR